MIKKMILPLAAPLLAGLLMLSCTTGRRPAKQRMSMVPAALADTAKKDSAKQMQPYARVIKPGTITQKGLLTVHRIGNRWYFEVADSLLNRDILIVNRISRGSAGVKIAGLLGYAGDEIGQNMVRFTRDTEGKLFIRRVSYVDVSRDSSENGLIRSINNSGLLPILAVFDVIAISPDRAASVIDVTSYLNTDNDLFFFNSKLKKDAMIGGFQADKSFIQSIRSFPGNTEIKTVKTYLVNEQPVTYELNSSVVLLPVHPMKPRYADQRVGYFSTVYLDYDAPSAVKKNYMISRWKLEPRQSDREKYRRGELVRPEKPIIFYIDPATPRKWVPYLIQGVNAWQRAFEKAGFKEAIYALEAPVDDTTWSLDDAQHSAIVYKASYTQNASGPSIVDPRSGEILESHINWYHNVQQILRDWYFIQASPLDPAARTMEFPDSLMGKLIRYVCTHEVGHTLGLLHNFAASAAVPVDSLRSRRYVAENGHTASVMDYARFNYVAQPEDSIAIKDLVPRIGVYDDWAIEWGYRWFPPFPDGQAERIFFNRWMTERLEKDKRLFFENNLASDPRNQMEDLGDDAVKASLYGIKNLGRIAAHLKEWTAGPGGDYSDLLPVYANILAQYRRYLFHVLANVGRLYFYPDAMAQGGNAFGFPPKDRIRSAVRFLNDQVFTKPAWLIDSSLFLLGVGGDIITLKRQQEPLIHFLVHAQMWNGLLFNETNQAPGERYAFDDLLNDLEAGIFRELDTRVPIDIYRRQVQKIYVFKLISNLGNSPPGSDMSFMDYLTLVRFHLRQLAARIDRAIPLFNDKASKVHLQDMREQINATLSGRQQASPQSIPVPAPALSELSLLPVINPLTERKSCWEQAHCD